jgi:tetratricopeptide (TPR) repeat protein
LALADFNHAIRLNPKEAKYYSSRAGVYMGKKDYDKALADMNEAIRLNPQEAEYYSSRANVYMGKKDYDKALADMNDAVRLNPAGKVYIHKRGSVYLAKQDYNRAVADYEAANINQPWARQELEEARRQAQSQRGQSAVQPQPVQQAATPSAPLPAPASPPNPQLEQMIANYEKSLGQCAVSKSDRCADVIYILGGLYYEKAKATSARADYRKSTDMFWRLSREYPKYQKLPDAFNLMGAVYLSAGHADTASIVFTQLLARFPKSQYVSAANLRLGEIAFAANDFGKAYEYFKKVKGMSGIDTPSQEAFSYRLGMSAYHAGDYKNAIVHLNVYVSGCDTGVIKTKSFYDKASEYLRLARQKK